MNLVWAYDLETVKGHYISVIENTPEIENTLAGCMVSLRKKHRGNIQSVRASFCF